MNKDFNFGFVQPEKRDAYNPLYTFNTSEGVVVAGAQQSETFGFTFTPSVWYRLRSVWLQCIRLAAAGGAYTQVFSQVDIVTVAGANPQTYPDILTPQPTTPDTITYLFGTSSPKFVTSLLLRPGSLVTVVLNAYGTFALNDNIQFDFQMEWTRENFKV